MVLTTQGVMELIDGLAPFSLAENWDNSGLQAGHPNWPVKKILLALDVTMNALKTALAIKADMLLTHHPLLIRPEKSIDFAVMPGAAIAFAAANTISIVSAHTNLDKSENGLNDWLAGMLGFAGTGVLVPDAPGASDGHCERQGLGRTGEINPSLRLVEFAQQVKSIMGLKTLRMVGAPDLLVKRAALCTGSGGSLIPAFFQSGAQVFVTGDIKYHEARDIEQAGLGLIDIGHFASEHIVIRFLVKQLAEAAEKAGYAIDIIGYQNEEDPFVTV